MITHLTDTNSAAVAAEISRARRNLGAASGLVLTLVVVCEQKHYADALEASLVAGREHPSRILLVVQGGGRSTRLDADIRTGEGDPGDVVTLTMHGELVHHQESVVLPLLLPDLPVVVWWPNSSPDDPGQDPIGALADRRITDAAGSRNPLAALLTRAKHHEEGDTDLAWTRITQWRALLAAALDQFPTQVEAAVVEAGRNNAPAALMAAWLESRLHVPVDVKNTRGPGITAVRLVTPAGDISVIREDGITATYAVPGQPRRTVALARRTINQLLTEELRRMDPDDVFNDTCVDLIKRENRATRQTAAKKVAKAEQEAAKGPSKRADKPTVAAKAPKDETPDSGEAAPTPKGDGNDKAPKEPEA